MNVLKISKMVPLLALVLLTGCGTISTMGKLEEGAGAEASKMWDRWIEANGDIAVATTWERKVKAGVTVNDIEQVFAQVASRYTLYPNARSFWNPYNEGARLCQSVAS